MGTAAHSLHLRDRDPDRLPGRGGSHPLHVGSMLCPHTPLRAADGPMFPHPGQAGGTRGSQLLRGFCPHCPSPCPGRREPLKDPRAPPWLVLGSGCSVSPSSLVHRRALLQHWPRGAGRCGGIRLWPWSSWLSLMLSPAGFSSCATCLSIWHVLCRRCCGRPTGGPGSATTTGEHRWNGTGMSGCPVTPHHPGHCCVLGHADHVLLSTGPCHSWA